MEQGAYDRTVIVPAMDENGKSFCEDVMTTEEYERIKKRMAPEIWEAEYMQNPVDMKGRLFNELKYIEGDEFEAIKDQIEGCVGYIDVSDQGADYTALAICAVIKRELYIVDYLMTRDNTDITIPLAAEKLKKWNVTYCRVESNSMGAMFSRELQRHSATRILQVHNTTNKITRIIMQSAFIMSRFNFVKNGDNMSELFIQNILSFSKEGKNKNDDAPDCLAGLSIFVQSMFKNLS
jgi:predicted phage terminase large subunit-like protein